MTTPARVLCKVRVKTIADRRTRRLPPTVPISQSEFSDEEKEVFRQIDRRHRARHSG